LLGQLGRRGDHPGRAEHGAHQGVLVTGISGAIGSRPGR
jgi:hypothetical protein